MCPLNGTLAWHARSLLLHRICRLLALPRHSKIGDERLLSEEERSCSRHHRTDRVWPTADSRLAGIRRTEVMEDPAELPWVIPAWFWRPGSARISVMAARRL